MATTKEHEPTFFERAESFVKKYRNILLGGLAVLVIGAGYLFYKSYQKGRLDKEAGPEISQAQQWFSQEQDSLALFGDGQSKGFLEIIDKYHGTKAANLSNYYAGIIYLKRYADYPNAVKHLEAFDGSASKTLNANAKFVLGHAHAQSGNTDAAAQAYRAATTAVDNETLTPLYLQTAGHYHSSIGKYSEAEGFYERIKNDYPNSTEAQDVDRYLAFVQQKQL